MKLYHSPLSRSVRIVWLLEELGLSYELETLPLEDPAPTPFAQRSPFGKVPALEDGDVVMFESGAILEYVLETHGAGRLAPPIGTPERAAFLQWVHFAEGTAFAGLGNIAWHTRFREDAERIPEAMDDYRTWARASIDAFESALGDREYAAGDTFSGADIMMGYTLFVARAFGAVGEEHPRVSAYLERLMARPALQKALRAG